MDGTLWQNGIYRAVLLQRLSDMGYQVLVVRYWKKHRSLVESQVESWAETSRALVNLGRTREAQKMLAGWRDRRGVTMWAVANYITCFPAVWSSQLRQIRSTCRDALAGLPHDHCARFLVHVQAEACAPLGDTQGLRETWEQHRSYFDSKEMGTEWFQYSRRHLQADIPTIVRYLEQDEKRLYRKAVRELRWQRINEWLGTKALFEGLIRVPWWTWLLLLWLLVQSLRNL